MRTAYGQELVLDLHGCNKTVFNRKDLRRFFLLLCERIDMEPQKLCFWDDMGLPAAERQTEAHTKGTSAVQFILTSNITVHVLDLTGKVFINIFSCKRFDAHGATVFCVNFFRAKSIGTRLSFERD